jgi:putative heme-binding domain-containing protein
MRVRIDRQVRDLAKEIPHADLKGGRRLFQQLCAACHILFDEGGAIGPNLTGAQRTSLEYLLENTLDPSAAVAKEFQMQIIELTDGRLVTGFLSAETETTVTIRTVNEELVTPKTAIRTQTASPLSIMPEGLLDALTPTQLRDLCGYLMSPAQVPLP